MVSVWNVQNDLWGRLLGTWCFSTTKSWRISFCGFFFFFYVRILKPRSGLHSLMFCDCSESARFALERWVNFSSPYREDLFSSSQRLFSGQCVNPQVLLPSLCSPWMGKWGSGGDHHLTLKVLWLQRKESCVCATTAGDCSEKTDNVTCRSDY